MAESSQEEQEKKTKPDDAPSKGDMVALGIGCLVFVLFFIAIVLVGMTRE